MKQNLTVTFEVETKGKITPDLIHDFVSVILVGEQSTAGKGGRIAMKNSHFIAHLFPLEYTKIKMGATSVVTLHAPR